MPVPNLKKYFLKNVPLKHFPQLILLFYYYNFYYYDFSIHLRPPRILSHVSFDFILLIQTKTPCRRG